MKTSLLKDLSTDEEKEEMELSFLHSALIRKQIAKVLLDKINTHNSFTRSKDAYGMASWAYLQADAVGYERAMREVMSLLDSEDVVLPPPAQPKRRGRPPKEKI